MFDELILEETLVDHTIDMRSDYECEVCGHYLEKDYDGTLFCTGCGANYTIETNTHYYGREVTN